MMRLSNDVLVTELHRAVIKFYITCCVELDLCILISNSLSAGLFMLQIDIYMPLAQCIIYFYWYQE